MYATLRPCEVKDVRYAARAVKDVRFTVLLVMCTVVARPDLAELRAVRFVYPSACEGLRDCAPLFYCVAV